jgi:hypothetical protein
LLDAAFVGLVTLTEILDGYLDCVFDLRRLSAADHGNLSLDMENRIAQWEDSLPPDLRRCIVRGVDLSIGGSANLRLTYLYVRLLARKLGLDDEEQSRGADPAVLSQRRTLARQAAENIVLFVQELDDNALGDFWLSSNAFALSSTVAFLLRNALEATHEGGGVAQSIPLKLASDMITALRSHQTRMSWDLANICIVQYADVVEKLMTAGTPTPESLPALEQFLMAEPVGIDDMFPSLWDMLNTT